MNIQTKITLMFFLISMGGLILVNTAVFYFVSDFSFEDFYDRLEARVRLTARINIFQDAESDVFVKLKEKYLEKLEQEKSFIFKVNNIQQLYNGKQFPKEFYKSIINNKSARYSLNNKFYVGTFFKTNKGNFIVIVGAIDPYGFKELQKLKNILIGIFVISMLLTFLAGKIFSYYTTQPVRKIIKSVNNISAENLSLRLEEAKGKDEIAELIQTFNEMLTRLETSFETQNNFVSNASHELKTPLSVITSETEILLSKKDIPNDIKVSASVILDEADKLNHILSSLLGLAQTGFNGKKQNWITIRIDELIFKIINSIKKVNISSNIKVDFSTIPENDAMLQIYGNTNLLELAVSNIISNACKYSNNKEVVVKLMQENEKIIISVIDKGIGIPERDQQHIFEPFFRASNALDFEGYGIGLPLTLNIIRLHKGSIGIRSQESLGTEMQILLPIAKEK